MEDENARMAAMKAKFEEEIAQLRESNKTMREAAAKREATAMGTGAAAAARQGPGGQGVSSVNDSLMRLHYSTRSPPKMPNDPAKTLSWIRRFEMFLFDSLSCAISPSNFAFIAAIRAFSSSIFITSYTDTHTGVYATRAVGLKTQPTRTGFWFLRT